MNTETSFVPLVGGCKCGNVRFRMEADPIITHCCHCRDCQRASGSAFRVNSMIESEHLTVTVGEPVRFEGAGSHPAMQCSVCRSTLWSFHPRLGPGIAIVGVGMLDEGERLPPEAHYFTRSKHGWVNVPPGLPTFTELGRPPKPSAGERIAAVLAKAEPRAN